MKNFIVAAMIAISMIGSSYAGECSSGNCELNQPRKVVTVTKNIVRETVRLPRRLINGCVNGVCRSRNVVIVR